MITLSSPPPPPRLLSPPPEAIKAASTSGDLVLLQQLCPTKKEMADAMKYATVAVCATNQFCCVLCATGVVVCYGCIVLNGMRCGVV